MLKLAPNGQSLFWDRNGSGPELTWTTFEYSTNGTSWSLLGSGSQIPGRWQLTGLSLPFNQNFYIRATRLLQRQLILLAPRIRPAVLSGPPAAGDHEATGVGHGKRGNQRLFHLRSGRIPDPDGQLAGQRGKRLVRDSRGDFNHLHAHGAGVRKQL